MSWTIENSWIILALPLGSALLLFLLQGLLNQNHSASEISAMNFKKEMGLSYLSTFSIVLSAIFSYFMVYDYFQVKGKIIPLKFEWLCYQDLFSINMGILIDPSSLMLIFVVTTVSALVHLYSISYMSHEIGLTRYFATLNFFTFSMLGLVVSVNLLQTFIFWELVGASSFMLIGFYYVKPSAVAASKKAFIITRFADLGFLIGVLILGYEAHHFFQNPVQSLFDFETLLDPYFIFQIDPTLLTIALIAIFIGAAGKSAMFPLHIWLPDAMEGPTPVSALIHAATMVVAGIYLIARLSPLYHASGQVLIILSSVGAFTALFAALIACVQEDIKRVLAYSTLSQLGYMMLSLGMIHSGGWGAAHYHLFTHAFFKALLFLGAGVIIHSLHTNSIWKMGGLAKKMKITHVTFLIATLAIAGLPPFSGFFSKDEILLSVWSHPLILTVALFVAGLTSFYMFRLYFTLFWGELKTEGAVIHDGSWLMNIPLIILAVFSLFSGFIPIPKLVSSETFTHATTSKIIPWVATFISLSGLFLAWWFYARNRDLKPTSHFIYKCLIKKFYIDEIYLYITRQLIFRFISVPIAWFDRHIVDGLMNLLGWIIYRFGYLLRFIQSGQIQHYGGFFIFGILFLFLFLIW